MTSYCCRRHIPRMKTRGLLVFFQLLISLQLPEGIQRVACQLSVSGVIILSCPYLLNFYQQYRPPTPPLRSPKVQEPPIESEDITSVSMSQCGSPPSPRPSLATRLPGAISTPSLHLSPSFMSDRTIISQNTGRIMAPWSQSLGTLANGWPPNCSTSPGKQMADVWSLPESPDQDHTFCFSYISCTFFTNVVVRLKNLGGED